jgi:DNA-binding NarL/FixJ family response regulator
MISAVETETTRVLLVEDHASFREALAYVLGDEPGFTVTAQAGSLEEARVAIRDADVALVDLGLPDGAGVEVIRELRRANRRCRLMVLSASMDDFELLHAVEAGAVGVLHKSSRLTEIAGAIGRLVRGEDPMPEETRTKLRLVGSTEERETRRDAERLTPRERKVLGALGQGLDNDEIARRLGMTLRTERAHMVHILAKLGAHSRLEALVRAARCGAVEIR